MNFQYDCEHEYSGLLNKLMCIFFVQSLEQGTISKDTEEFFKPYAELCRAEDEVYCPLEFLAENEKFVNFSLENISTVSCDHLMLIMEEDAFRFLAYEKYLSDKLGFSFDEPAFSIYDDFGDCSILSDAMLGDFVPYREICSDSSYVLDLDLFVIIERLNKLDRLITENRFLVRLLGFSELRTEKELSNMVDILKWRNFRDE